MSDFKALVKHSTNYFFATIAQKALAFISIPLYTKLLSVYEYGVMSVFLSTVGIVQVLLTLNTEVAVSRYFYDARNEQDFKDFCTTSIKISSNVWLIMSLVIIAITPWLADKLMFSKTLTLCLIPVASYSVINSIFTQIYQPLLQSRKIAIVSSVQTYLAFGLSVLFMLCLDSDKYYGYVFGTIMAMIILSTYLIRQIKPFYVKAKIKKEHVKYLLNYSLPYIPYTLSGIILAQFGRIFMSNYAGFDAAGLYSFVANIGMIMMILISLFHSAWNPYYLQYMTDKKYSSIDKDYDLIWRITLVGAAGLSIFGKDIACILSSQVEYLSGMYMLPLIVLGYVFYQWAYVYLRSTGFAKRTIWNAVSIMISGSSNIALSFLLVERFQGLGIAVAFCVSYFVLMVVSYLINRFILKQYVPNVRLFVFPLVVLTFIYLIYYILDLGTYGLFVRILVFIFISCILLWKYFDYVMSAFKKI